MRVLLIESASDASNRHRVRPLAELLARRGHQIETEIAPHGSAARARCVAAARTADVVFLQRRLWALLGVGSLRRRSRRLIFDIDDAVGHADGSDGRFTSLTRALKFRALCRAADLVTAGNTYLADLSRAAGARRVEIFPTLVLEHELSGASRPRGPGERLRLVWLGSASTKRYLLGVLPALVPVLESGVCELMVIADSDQGPALANTRYRRWDVELVTRWLRECHVGLAPLPDDPWTRGKCALKVLQYGAAALPTIAAPVGVQRDVIHPGHNGLHATTPDEWQRAVRTLAGDEAARRAMGQEAHARVRDGYSWGAWAARWTAVFEGG